MDKDMKLYVWEDVLRDYSPGMAVALARSLEEAKTLLRAQASWAFLGEGDELDRVEPTVVTTPTAFHIAGGG